MSESDGKTELTGLARSIDALFVGKTAADSPPPSGATDVASVVDPAEIPSPLAAEMAPEEHDLGLATATIGAAGGAAMLLDDPWGDEATQDGGVEEAVIDEMLPEEVLLEGVVVDEPSFEESVVEEAFIDEPVLEQAIVEEPAVEEPAVEEPVAEEVFGEELVVEEAFVEELVVEEAFVEELAVEEAFVEELAIGAPVVEEPAVEEDSLVEPSGAGDLPTDDAVAEAGVPGASTIDGGEATAEEFVEGPLDIAVGAYVGGDLARASEIESLAAELTSSRDIAPITRAVVALTLAAGDPADASVYAVAESIMDPVVLALLARQMGAERVEERRHEYYSVCRTIGDEMAVAVRNDLAETTDRLARRIHCEALVEMGASGRRMIEEMAEDDNRFLVRNAVAILGDLGGDRAVELVTSALANPDPRVRREALKSLVKLESEDSGALVLGLLDDADDDVRLAAAVAAGELQVERALKPLMLILETSKDPDECLPVIRALGQLGDPGAVNSIEKHAVRSIFNKPRTDVRIASYRALHQIGTPHARQLLLDVVRDKDEEVKTAVKGMLYSK